MVPSTELTAILDFIYTHLMVLRPDSPPEAFEALAGFFTPDCQATLRSMREGPKNGREAFISDVKDLLTSWRLLEQRVVAQAVDTDRRTVLCAMENRIDVLGDVLDPFAETATVTFSLEGLVEKLLMYSCRGPIV